MPTPRQAPLIEQPTTPADWLREAWARIKTRAHFARMSREEFNACKTRRAVLAGYARQLETEAAIAAIKQSTAATNAQCWAPGRAHHHAPWGTA
jgi:hypothetical protein